MKLINIFLEFDEDGSSKKHIYQIGKLEIDEMVEMFNRNNIDVTMKELLVLFFKGKKINKNEDPYLNVYQFIEFALSKESDQNFRNFMRKIKKKIYNKKEKERKKLDLMNEFEEKQNKEEDHLFLPMNFNLVLDYFNNKGKDREKMENIENALINIQEYMKKDQNEIKIETNQNYLITKSNKTKENIEEKGDINMEEIMLMFEELMKPKKSIVVNMSNYRKKNSYNSNDQSYIKDDSLIKQKNEYNKNSLEKPLNLIKQKSIINNNELFPIKDKNYFTDFFIAKEKRDNKDKLSKQFYSKYHSVLLAAEKTNEELKKDNTRKITNNLNSFSNIQTTTTLLKEKFHKSNTKSFNNINFKNNKSHNLISDFDRKKTNAGHNFDRIDKNALNLMKEDYVNLVKYNEIESKNNAIISNSVKFSNDVFKNPTAKTYNEKRINTTYSHVLI